MHKQNRHTTVNVRSKLELRGERITLMATDVVVRLTAIFNAIGCNENTSHQVAEHLSDTSLCGIESHGVMRTLQYAEQFNSGYMKAGANAVFQQTATGVYEVDGGGGIGVPAMQLAFKHGMRLSADNGISALAVRNVGHTGRHGAFADAAAGQGFLTFLVGGGNRRTWRQVAPHGGTKALLPTNPWCVGIPGGNHGPVVLDFATSKIAGGWIYAAQSADALLPANCIIDSEGRPTRDPGDYFNGGAILPSGEHKGYALAVIAELIAEAMLGPVTTEANWLLICIDTNRYNAPSRLHEIAEEILSELRTCPPAPGFDRVEVPGERERNYRKVSNGKIAVPEATWSQIGELALSLGVG